MDESKINVLYVTHTSSKYTGSNKSLLALLSGLKSKNINPTVITPKRSDMTFVEELERIGVQYFVLEYYMPVYPVLDRLKDYILFLPKLIRAVADTFLAEKTISTIAKDVNAHLIHTNVGPMTLGFKVARKRGLPHIWHLREFQDLDFNLKTWYSKKSFCTLLGSNNNYPIAISKAVFDHFSLKFPAQVVYNGVFHASQTMFVEDKQQYFLYVGYLRESKGILKLLSAFAEFSKLFPSFQLKIAGDSTDNNFKASLENFVYKNNLQTSVRFLGRRDDISELMAHASALVVPSFNEAFGRVTAEAMFNGCLVLGNKASGTEEIIKKVGVGFLYNTEAELIDMMTDVAANYKQYNERLRVGQQKAVSNFSIESYSQHIYDLYNKILNK